MTPGEITPEQKERFLESLVAGEREACRALVTSALDGGAPIRAVYERLLRDALYEVGDRWEHGRLTVEDEHLATAIVEDCLAIAYPRVQAQAALRPASGRRAVVSCGADEYHQVGGRMVADLLQLRGWSVHFLGAGTSPEALVREVGAHRPDLVLLSVSIADHLPAAERALALVRGAHPQVPVVVGGRAFDAAGHDLPDRHPGVRWLPSLEALEAELAAQGS